jgi:hypothetical protein
MDSSGLSCPCFGGGVTGVTTGERATSLPPLDPRIQGLRLGAFRCVRRTGCQFPPKDADNAWCAAQTVVAVVRCNTVPQQLLGAWFWGGSHNCGRRCSKPEQIFGGETSNCNREVPQCGQTVNYSDVGGGPGLCWVVGGFLICNPSKGTRAFQGVQARRPCSVAAVTRRWS